MLKPNHFKIYNASAGSGKTYTLVKEFLSLLLVNPDPNAFSRLLAITFTNKAANEMKERIIKQLKKLKDASENDADMNTYAAETGLQANIIRDRSSKILTAILHNYGLFAVSTIDKFNLRLMRSFSQDLGLSVNFDVEMDTGQMLTESVDLMFSELHENPLLTNILSDIALNNLATDKRWDISDEIINDSKDLLTDKFLNEIQAFQQLSLEDFNRFRRRVNSMYFDAMKAMKRISGEMLDEIETLGLQDEHFHSKSKGIAAYFKKINAGKFELPGKTHAKLIEQEKYINNKSFEGHPVNQKITAAVNEIVSNFVQYVFWGKIYKKLNAITVLNEIEKRLNQIKNENNILLISEFNKIIGNNIKDQPAPFIYEKIGSKYKSYFIDEFQDTSDLQWNNLLPLLKNAFAEDQTTMIVGDPKQSIYRWRGGNPNLMISLSNSAEDRIETENLPDNWRSHEEIIHFNNRLYHFISDQIFYPEYRQLYENSYQNPKAKKGGFVQLRIHPRPERGSGLNFKDTCMDMLLLDIKHAEENGFKWNEMAVLVRTNKEGQRVAEFLTANGYNVLSSDSLLLQNSNEVMLLVAFIQFLSNPNLPENRVNLLLRLYQNKKIISDDITSFIREAIQKTEIGFMTFLEENGIQINLSFLPFQSLYEQVSAALLAFGLDQNANAYISFFMDEILKFQYQPEPTPQNFMEYWSLKSEKLSISIPEGQNAIKLMTIHKSKGLEFKVVFIPFAEWSPKPSGIWIPIEDEQVNSFYISDFNNPELLPQEIQELMIFEEAQSEMDSLNELYVATTRAVEQLYIITPEIESSGKPIASYLNDFVKDKESYQNGFYQVGNPKRISEPEKVNIENQIIIPFISNEWSKKVRISSEHALLWNERRVEAIGYGNKIHAVLEQIGHSSESADVLDRFELHGFITAIEKQEIAEELNRLFNHEKLKAVFNAESFLNERDFIAWDGTVFRPDRLAKTDEGWVLVDYKTGDHSAIYAQQLAYYAQQLNNLGYKIKHKYLIYLGNENPVVEV